MKINQSLVSEQIDACIKLINIADTVYYTKDASVEIIDEIIRLHPIAGFNEDYFTKDTKYVESLTFLHKLEDIFQDSNIAHTEVITIALRVTDMIIRHHIVLYAIKQVLTIGNVTIAESYIKHMPDIKSFGKIESTQHRGYREILSYYAEAGNLEAFLKTLKLSAPAKDARHEIIGAKISLIEQYSKQNSYELATALAQRKEFGPKYLYAALKPHAGTLPINDMQTLLQNPAFDVPKLYLREELTMLNLVGHYKNSQDEKIFEQAFTFADNIDPKIKTGVAKMRDWFLLELGIASPVDSKLRLRCRKAIKNASIKRELDRVY
jgi:hypothetical protein